MVRIQSDQWQPKGIDSLEPQAWKALRQTGSSCVVAGPGAGKTEFLAQRAVYLLETGICPPPRRILAISFKSDAAHNLAERIRKRCPPELAGRFVSLTFDAFTKSLVDRFHSAISMDWQPTIPYAIAFPNRRQIEAFLLQTRLGAPPDWQPEVAGISPSDFESRYVGAYRLPLTRTTPRSGLNYAIDSWWEHNLWAQEVSSLTFVGLNRLAELLLRTNPQIIHALRATYPFVFVDEFQDTTHAQYDFLLSAFADGKTAVTSVGDDKQRIMVWAGARTDSFPCFQEDFKAARIPLHFNFRSSPDLVRIQHVVAQALDSKVKPAIAHAPKAVDGDVAQVWISRTTTAEMNHLAQWLKVDMAKRGLAPRDYAILVRQRADDYETDLSGPLENVGLQVRNESHTLGRTTLQDLLADDFCRIAVAILRLGATRRSPNAWQTASEAILDLRGGDRSDEGACKKAEIELTAFLKEIRATMALVAPSKDSATTLAARVIGYLGLGAMASSFEYSTGDLLSIMTEAFSLHLAACAESSNEWVSCLDQFDGVSKIPLMTVHKSKGLEYDTIVFVGLDDQAWWSHNPGNPEGIATFFVALSRAKQRAIFAFCQARGQRRRVAELYILLTTAGVPEIAI